MEALYYGRVSMTATIEDPYQANLRHVAEPAAPSGREKAVGADLASFEALWLTEALRDYAHYGDHPTEEHTHIALAYVQYIDEKVRDEGRNYVRLYAHTQVAADTLMGAMFHVDPDDQTGEVLKQAVASPLADLFLAHAEDDAPPEPATVEAGDTVEFEDGAAMEAVNEAQLAKAEAAAMGEIEDKVATQNEKRSSPYQPEGGR